MTDIVELNSFQLSDSDGLRRHAPSNVEILKPSFWDGYDCSTLFYDAIDLGGGKFKLIALRPLSSLHRYLDISDRSSRYQF